MRKKHLLSIGRVGQLSPASSSRMGMSMSPAIDDRCRECWTDSAPVGRAQGGRWRCAKADDGRLHLGLSWPVTCLFYTFITIIIEV